MKEKRGGCYFMKKTKIICAAVLGGALALTGCDSTIPDMTREETKMVAEYAAQLLLKYDKNYVSRVVDTTEYHEEEQRRAEEERRAQEAAAAEQARLEAEAAAALEEENGGGKAQAAEQPTISSIEEFYQLQGVSIRYGGYGVFDSYPQQAEGEELFFSMSATEGNRLLVLYFDVTNTSGSEMVFNMMDVSPKFRISVNGSSNKVAMLTSLPEELATYEGTIGADETVRTVVIVEIPAQDSDAIDTITLTVRGNAGSAQLPLQ